jgi:polar amino acid transport system permease protein
MSGFPWDWGFVWSIFPALLNGLKLTLVATLVGSALAFVLGLGWIALRLANLPIISPAVNLLVQFLRGTPFLVQLYFVFYVLPNYGLTFSALVSGIVGLAIYNSAPVSEIYRAGIEGVAPGQWEACLTLGLPVRWVWSGVVLPQAFQTVTPMLANIVIAMFKDTAVLSTITVAEMMSRATDLSMLHFRFVEPMTIVAGLYFVVSYASAKGVRALERWSTARV